MFYDISKTNEFNFAPHDKKMWAIRHPDQHMSARRALELEGFDANKTVTVEANDGQEHDVDVQLLHFTLTPAKKYKQTWTILPETGQRALVTFLKGASIKAKSAIYFTDTQFKASKSVTELNKKIQKITEKHRKQHHEMLLSELKKTHTPAVTRALKVLPKLIAKDDTHGIFDFFKEEEFKMGGMTEKDFEDFVKIAKTNKEIPNSWTLSSGPDKWGHQAGKSRYIDWQNKKFGVESWSSDD